MADDDAETVVHQVERSKTDHEPMSRRLAVELLDDGWPIGLGFIMASVSLGYYAALDTVIEATAFTWPTLLTALQQMEYGSPLPSVITIGGVGLLLLGVGLGWQWRRQYTDGGEDE